MPEDVQISPTTKALAEDSGRGVPLSKQCALPDGVAGVIPTAENVGCRKLDSGGRDQAVRLAW
jgi:hypothetical protein